MKSSSLEKDSLEKDSLAKDSLAKDSLAKDCLAKDSFAKAIGITLILVFAALFFASCVNDSVTYCPFCGKSNIEEISTYDKDTGITTIYYKCNNNDCGKKFGAGKAP